MEYKSLSVVGGDLRSIKLANLFKDDGYKVKIFGFKNADFDVGIEEEENLTSALTDIDAIIGPIPLSNDNVNVNTPYYGSKISMNELFKGMNKNQLFLAGKINEKITYIAGSYGIKTIDLLDREEMAVLNAIPTAEGAIQIALEEMPTTLHNANALVLGYGRIGKMLASMLKGIGANVTVEARKFSDIAWIRGYNYKPIMLQDLKLHLKDADVIFNTIPHIILDETLLSKIRKDTLIIDLASKPGGVDIPKAGELGLKTIWALSLPGKVAPVSAAGFIKETICNVFSTQQ